MPRAWNVEVRRSSSRLALRATGCPSAGRSQRGAPTAGGGKRRGAGVLSTLGVGFGGGVTCEKCGGGTAGDTAVRECAARVRKR